MKGLLRCLKVKAKQVRALLGWQVSLDDLSLRDAKALLPKCKSVKLTDTDRFKIEQLRKAASEMGYGILNTGEVKPIWPLPKQASHSDC